jgi:asparagine N-glycosylation enzyme membrane subunit Stt3
LTQTEHQAKIVTMSYEAERLALKSWLEASSRQWDALQAKLPKLPPRRLYILSAGGLTVYALFLRCLHLLNSEYYYLISPDSYFFHWAAGIVMAGEQFPAGGYLGTLFPLHSGLTYPLAYIAKAASYVFGISSADALNLVCKLLPLVLALISMVLIYLAATKICNRRAGLFSAFAWAALSYPILFGAAGYVDRDGLSVLLAMTGVLVFYLSRGWHLRVFRLDVGWLLAGLGILVIEYLLYLEWSFVGPVMLLAVILAYFLARFLIGYFDRLETEPSPVRRLTAAATEANWRTFAVIVIGHAIYMATHTYSVNLWWEFAIVIARYSGEMGVSEMKGITLGQILAYRFFLILIIIGLYLAWKRRTEGAVFFSCWFLSLLILSLFANRVLLYAAPAVCLLSGVSLAFLWDWMKKGKYQPLKQISVTALLCFIFLLSLLSFYLGSGTGIAPDEDWQNALAYLKDDTAQESVVMSQWAWGYWILDLGQRKPVVDNGYYGYNLERLKDVGTAYATTDPSEAAQIMEKYGADYLVFGEIDQDFSSTILGWAGLEERYKGFDEFPPDSLITRSLNGEFESGGGLEVAYRSIPNEEVVILRLVPLENQ